MTQKWIFVIFFTYNNNEIITQNKSPTIYEIRHHFNGACVLKSLSFIFSSYTITWLCVCVLCYTLTKNFHIFFCQNNRNSISYLNVIHFDHHRIYRDSCHRANQMPHYYSIFGCCCDFVCNLIYFYP